ncbi:hypothetical protein CPB84DRAFT_1687612, partial [Gymnopilus junonius]
THYFAQYPSFRYNADSLATSEFRRMCSHFGWTRQDKARIDAQKAFRIALTQQFNARYGMDEESLLSWKLLCARLGIDPIPNSTYECREVFCATHVNLVDLADGEDTVLTFPTVNELSAYTKREEKFFPREEAYAGGLLKYLLRNIISSSLDSERNGLGLGYGRGKPKGPPVHSSGKQAQGGALG